MSSEIDQDVPSAIVDPVPDAERAQFRRAPNHALVASRRAELPRTVVLTLGGGADLPDHEQQQDPFSIAATIPDAWRGDGRCDKACDNVGCEHDGGDCQSSSYW